MEQLFNSILRNDVRHVKETLEQEDEIEYAAGQQGVVTPLMASVGYWKVFKYLLKKYEFVDQTDSDGWNVFHYFQKKREKDTHYFDEMMISFDELLRKESRNEVINKKDKKGFSPYSLAIMHRNSEIALKLANAGADINVDENLSFKDVVETENDELISLYFERYDSLTEETKVQVRKQKLRLMLLK